MYISKFYNIIKSHLDDFQKGFWGVKEDENPSSSYAPEDNPPPTAAERDFGDAFVGKTNSLDKETFTSYDESDDSSPNTTIYRRVQGGNGTNASQFRIQIKSDGTLYIENKESNLNISVDRGEHANYFLKKRGSAAQVVEFELPTWFDHFLKEYAIPQANYHMNRLNQKGSAPKITDITTPGISYELPPPWIQWLEEYATNPRIFYQGES